MKLPRVVGPLGILGGLYLLSGAGALLQETLWTKWLTLVFGHTIYALTTVLAAFMAGLALGSRLFARWLGPDAPLEDTVELYGRIEIGVALFAAISAFEVPVCRQLYAAFFPISEPYASLSLIVKFLLAAVVMLPPAALMGATFPVIGIAARKAPMLARFYALNTAGGALAVFLAGFVLIPVVGLKVSFAAGVLLSAAAGAGALALVRRGGFAAGSEGAEPVLPAPPEKGAKAPRAAAEPEGEGAGTRPGFVLAALFVSGAVGLGLEVAWTRLLSVFILNTTYTFTLILSTFLLGTVLGGEISERLLLKRLYAPLLYGAAQAAAGTVALLVFPLLVRMPAWLWSWHLHPEDPAAGWGGALVGTVLTALLASFVPSLLMGLALPVAIALLERGDRAGLGEAAGRGYAVNCVGGIFGAIAAGFFLIPVSGIRNTLLIFALALSALGVIFLLGTLLSRARIAGAVGLASAGALLAAAWFLLPPRVISHWGAFEESKDKPAGGGIYFYAEGPNATVTVEGSPTGLMLKINGIDVAGMDPESLKITQKLQGHLPLLLHPNPKEVLTVGLGSGGTAFSAHLHGVSVDTVEIEPAVVRATQFFLPINGLIMGQPNFHLWVHDGREWLLGANRKFDVILTESIHPAIAGNGSLYSLDYFDLCKARLYPGGIVSVWVPLYRMAKEDLKTIASTFAAAFPFATMWKSSRIARHILFIGSEAPFAFDAATLEARIRARPAPVAGDLASIGIKEGSDLYDLLERSDPEIRVWVREVPINTDDHPILEYSVPKSMSEQAVIGFD